MKGERFNRLLMSVLIVLVIPALGFGAIGKVRGFVTDSETGEPLMGANIQIVGTMMGAATDENGEYVILNIPVGKYDLSATFMGYQKVAVEGIIVNSGLTTFRDVALPKTVLEGQQVTIVAERPLIDKAETNEIHYVRGEDIAQMPIRGVAAVITGMAGVINDNGVIHVRGGRPDEIAYYVDNINVTKPQDDYDADDYLGVSIISNAIEEVQMQTGGMSAEYGGKMSGVTVTTIKTGGSKYNLTGEVISDDFWALKNQDYEILGINKLYSFGYNDYVLTASGPVWPKTKNVKFFVAGQIYNRQSNATWFDGFQQDSLSIPGKWYKSDGVTAVYDTLDLFMDYAPGRVPGGGSEGQIVNGNLLFDFNPIRLKVGGSWSRTKATSQAYDPQDLFVVNYRPGKTLSGNYSGYFNFTHTLSPTMYYTLGASYLKDFSTTGDMLLWDNFAAYGDTLVNPALLDLSQERYFYLPFDDNFNILYPGTPRRSFLKNEQEKISAKLDFTKQFGKAHELKLGGEYEMSTIRYFNLNVRDLAGRLRIVNKDPSKYTLYDIYTALNPRLVGYDIYGNKVDEDQSMTTLDGVPVETAIELKNKPQDPTYGGVYLQDRIELRDLIINAGLRLEYMSNGCPSLKDLSRLTPTSTYTIAPENWDEERTYTYLLPRLGFSFPVTDMTVFHAQFGKYVQPPDPYQVWAYRGYTTFSQHLYGAGYFAPLNNPNLKPERQTSYEFGLQKQFGSNASLDVTTFYKDTRDLLTRRVIFPAAGFAEYPARTFTLNGDFGTIKGVSATFNLRRTSRIQSQVNYTYSVAQGTGSRTDEHNDIAWQENSPTFPKVISFLEYDIRHKGTVNVDVRTLPEDGPEIFGMRPFGNVGLNLKFDFNSGAAYTRIPTGDAYSEVYEFNAPPPLEAPNQSRLPWFYQLDGKLDKTYTLGPVRFNVYLWAINIMGSKSWLDAWRGTGRADTDGYLQTDAGRVKAATQGEDWVKWYGAVLTDCGTLYYQTPRQVRMGVKFEL